MKEVSFADMSLSRLLELKKTWEIQIVVCNKAGHQHIVASLRLKLDKLEKFIELRRQENLNDLFA